MKILFLGSVFSEEALRINPATNQASHNWSKGFLNALKDKSFQVDCVSFKNEQIWPKSKIFVKKDLNDFDNNFKTYPISYLNFPLLRSLSLSFSFYFRLKKILEINKYDIVFSYNLYPWNHRSFKLFRKNKKLNIPIILDEDNPLKNNWRSFHAKSKNTDGLVFLSYWGFKNYPFKKKCYHLDSGSSSWMGYSDFKTNEKPIIVYSGKYQESYGGLPQLSKILNSISFDCQILLTGKANKDLIYKYFSENPKIEYLGFLDEVSLDKVFKKADIFINYRPPEVEDNIMIFPSKINQYLSYGKPVISSFTPGLSPDYENVLFYPESEDINSYLELFDNILKFNILEKKVLYYKIKNWFDKYKTWDILTDNLCNWINDNFNE